MSEKLKVGILGGTGMVGQRFISLLENHPGSKWLTIAQAPFRRQDLTKRQSAADGKWTHPCRKR